MFQMKMPLKKQYPSLWNIVYFFMFYYIGVISTSLIFLPCSFMTSNRKIAIKSQTVVWTFWSISAFVFTFFLMAWLRNPGYVYKKPNPNFHVIFTI